MTTVGVSGLVLTPGAGAGRDHSALVAIDQAVSGYGIAVERVEFPARAAGRRRPDPPDVCIRTVRTATHDLAGSLDVPTCRVAAGGRSMGGRMCSMAAAQGLDVAALVLVSYPLHPPKSPDGSGPHTSPSSTCPASSSPAAGMRSARQPNSIERSRRFRALSPSSFSTATTRYGGGTPRWPKSCHVAPGASLNQTVQGCDVRPQAPVDPATDGPGSLGGELPCRPASSGCQEVLDRS